MRRRLRKIKKTEKEQGYYYKGHSKLLEELVYAFEQEINGGTTFAPLYTYVNQLRKDKYPADRRQIKIKDYILHLEKNHLCIYQQNSNEEQQKELHHIARHAEYQLAKQGYQIISSQD